MKYSTINILVLFFFVFSLHSLSAQHHMSVSLKNNVNESTDGVNEFIDALSIKRSLSPELALELEMYTNSGGSINLLYNFNYNNFLNFYTGVGAGIYSNNSYDHGTIVPLTLGLTTQISKRLSVSAEFNNTHRFNYSEEIKEGIVNTYEGISNNSVATSYYAENYFILSISYHFDILTNWLYWSNNDDEK